jgi:hypothetical protein
MSKHFKRVSIALIATMAGKSPERCLELANQWHLPFSRCGGDVWVDPEDMPQFLSVICHNAPLADGDL